ncbi:RNA polymerase-associated protein RapA [Salinivirga cyanobacteriivorans]|uniref:RNA polymerase-associated protein RapA n=1 Tax=Salinivirga cyanobacteriivorans TaxID=1307839 RepID=A0A0S2HYB8_9BACT|nr:DEAD/DEAH box helicase [Salinivirga cyanobacteriivorans]ALO14812.1 RNA polymerase-associated protein RapA [Salinivirga cyanobacteriivorans]
MAGNYSKTWWGEQWLRSLSNIDYSNRLPRGRRYANNGSVVSIDFEGNRILAKVQGTRRTPYSVTITVPEFTQTQKTVVMETITANPLMLSKLLNRELPVQLHEKAVEKNIQIFPRSWTDLSMNCSCPDWAVPCKHIASVIYIIANEIDRNPFIIFQLHGVHILSELNKRGFLAQETEVHIKSLTENAIERNENDWDSLSEDFSGIDFSKIPELQENLMTMLDEESLFYKGNFKNRLSTAYKKIKKFTENYTTSAQAEEENTINYAHCQKFSTCVTETFEYDFTSLYSRNKSLVFEQDEFAELIDFIENIPHKKIAHIPHALRQLHTVYTFTKKILQQGAFVPELRKNQSSVFMIHWMPALMNENVKDIFAKLTQTMPGNAVYIMEKGQEKFFKREDQLKLLISQFMKFFIKQATAKFIKPGGVIESFFFNHQPYRFTALGEKEIPQTIQRWVSKFHIHLKNFVPVIKVDVLENNFAVDILVENREKAYEEPVSLNHFLSQKSEPGAKTEVLKDLTLLTSAFPQLESTIQTSGKHKLWFNSIEFSDILLRILPLVKMYGIRLLLPTALKNIIRPRPSLKLSRQNGSETNKRFLSLDKMLNFEWQMALGDKVIDQQEFFSLVEGLSGVVKIHNQYININPADIEKLQNSLEKPPALKTGELIQTALTEEYNGAKINLTAEARELLDQFLKNEEVALPKGLHATLRPYQQRGYSWMYKNTNTGIGSIIADDMGLGKTIQVIALLLKLKEENRLDKNKALVIVPTTLLSNWEKEIDKFAPELQYATFHGPNRQINKESDVLLTSYGIARSDQDELSKIKWCAVVIDESQNIKNPGTAQTKAIKKLKSDIRIAMSGTPVENRLSEYWSIFDFTNKGFLGSAKKFSEQYAKPIEVDRNKKAIERFKTITSPFIMRRLKTDKTIISDLPKKVENEHYAQLTKEQAAVYQNILNEVMPSIDEIEQNDKDRQMERKGLVLKMIIALKQVCNHPSQYLKKEDHDPNLSGKVQLLFQLLHSIYENGEKVLIFTQFKETGLMLEQLISAQFNQPVQFLHGGTTRNKREQMVEDFQSENYLKTFILSIKAGGTGLNLTEGSHVIHFDLWWNPAVEQQATDRAFRIGQKKNVMVYRLITRNSFEEKINEMIQSKKELSELTVSTGEKWIGNLSNKELKALVSLEG